MSMIKVPDISYLGMEKEKMGFHLLMQIMGKLRMCRSPRKNHWWNVTLYVDSQGFSTSPIPFSEGMESLTLNLNVHQHRLEILDSRGNFEEISLAAGPSVAECWEQLQAKLKALRFDFEIQDQPYDLPIKQSFDKITEYSYSADYVKKAWKTFLWIDGVFKEYSGKFYGKTCPVHLYWHSLDLAITRFSGKRAPKMDPSARISDKDAYSHECISIGFWLGDENTKEPCFYSYTYPAPDGIEKQALAPASAYWMEQNGSPMALLPYQTLKASKNPRKDLLDFMDSAYFAGAKLAGWDVEALTVPNLTEM